MLDSSLVFCTLLGPEGPGRRRKVPIGPLDHRALRSSRSSDFGLVEIRLEQEEYRPYFENYTVDASILKMRTR